MAQPDLSILLCPDIEFYLQRPERYVDTVRITREKHSAAEVYFTSAGDSAEDHNNPVFHLKYYRAHPEQPATLCHWELASDEIDYNVSMMDKVVHPFRWSTPDYDQDQPIPVRFILMTGDQCKAACQLPDIMPGRGILGGNLFALMVAGSTRPNRAGYGTTAYFLGFTDYLDYTGLLASRLGRPGLPQQLKLENLEERAPAQMQNLRPGVRERIWGWFNRWTVILTLLLAVIPIIIALLTYIFKD